MRSKADAVVWIGLGRVLSVELSARWARSLVLNWTCSESALLFIPLFFLSTVLSVFFVSAIPRFRTIRIYRDPGDPNDGSLLPILTGEQLVSIPRRAKRFADGMQERGHLVDGGGVVAEAG